MHVSFGLFCHIGAVSVLLYACSNGRDEITSPDTDPTPTAGASSTMPGSETCAATADSIQTNVFKVSCDGAGCHGAQNPAAGLNLVGSALDRLMTTSPALCSGWLLVVPGSPEKSLLYQSFPPTLRRALQRCRSDTLPQAQLDQFSAWICSGAPNN